ncbi:MAG: hypothetical protein L0Y56_09120 [Nitrospira sp.]|nr:hypothetical protein [Nitrospira sp.]
MNHKQKVYPELGMLGERVKSLSYIWRTSHESPPPGVLKEATQIVHKMRVNLNTIEASIIALKQQSR